MTSSILLPRRLLALCSPITQVMASATLLLPQPFGPTMAVTPLSKASSERSEKDLNPLISRRSRRMDTPRLARPEDPDATAFSAGWDAERQTDRFRGLSPSGRGGWPQADKSVVSLTRPSYSGKTNLTPQLIVVVRPNPSLESRSAHGRGIRL